MPVPLDFAAMAALRESAFVLAERSPLDAARVLARAMKRQTTGAKRSLVRALCAQLAEAEPGILADLATDVAALAAGKLS